MGRTITPKYRVEFLPAGRCTAFCWDKSWGRANETNLVKFVMNLNASVMLGGVNDGAMPPVTGAVLIEQETGREVAKWTAK